jgi:hypothetical protein
MLLFQFRAQLSSLQKPMKLWDFDAMPAGVSVSKRWNEQTLPALQRSAFHRVYVIELFVL